MALTTGHIAICPIGRVTAATYVDLVGGAAGRVPALELRVVEATQLWDRSGPPCDAILVVLARSHLLSAAIDTVRRLRASGHLIVAGVFEAAESTAELRSLYAAKLGIPVIGSGDPVRLAGHLARPFAGHTSLWRDAVVDEAADDHQAMAIAAPGLQRTCPVGGRRHHLAHVLEARRAQQVAAEAAPGSAGVWLRVHRSRLAAWLAGQPSGRAEFIALSIADLDTARLERFVARAGLQPAWEEGDANGDVLVVVPRRDVSDRPWDHRTAQDEMRLDRIDAVMTEHGLVIAGLSTAASGTLLLEYAALNRFTIRGPAVRPRPELVLTTGLTGLGDIVWLSASIPALLRKYRLAEAVVAAPGPQADLLNHMPGVRGTYRIRCCPEWRLGIGMSHSLLQNFLATRWVRAYADLTWVPAASTELPDDHRHLSDLFAALLGVQRDPGPPRVSTTERDRRRAQEYVAEHGLAGGFTIGVQFAGSTVTKSWPAEYRRAFRRALEERLPGVRVLDMDEIYRTNRLTVRELAEALRVCRLFVGVDSLGGHLAAAVHCPTITLYGWSRPRNGNNCAPLGDNIGIEPPIECTCSGYLAECSRCLQQVTPDAVLDVVTWKIIEKQQHGEWLDITAVGGGRPGERVVRGERKLSSRWRRVGLFQPGRLVLEVDVNGAALAIIGHDFLCLETLEGVTIGVRAIHVGLNFLPFDLHAESVLRCRLSRSGPDSEGFTIRRIRWAPYDG
jgi:ADP-heptose:LPS heptosyltransferase